MANFDNGAFCLAASQGMRIGETLRMKSAVVLIAALIAFLPLGRNRQAKADDQPFPVAFRFHCGGKARYSIPNAMGFSPDSSVLGIVYKGRLILVDVATGKEIERIKASGESTPVNYNYVVFEPSGKYCCIGKFGHDAIELQFFNIEKGNGSAPVERTFQGHPANPSDYVSYGYNLPLRQWLAFEKKADPSEATFEVTLANSEGTAVEKLHASVSFRGDKNLQLAERIYPKLRPRREKSRRPSEEAKKREEEIRGSTGYGMQVALSQDQRLLLSQSVSGQVTSLRYRFGFFDVKSSKKVVEIAIPTGIDWRFNGSRGFAFSPDFRYLARTNPAGRVIVHDLSQLVERRFDGYRSILIPFRDSKE